MEFRSLWKILPFVLLLLAGCGKSRKAQQKTSAKQHVEKHQSGKSTDKGLLEEYARLLEVGHQALKNEELYFFVDRWQGVPYRYGGEDRNGVDCSGFAGKLYSEVYGRQIPRTTSQLAQATKKVPQASLREGDLVFFNIQGKKDSHVGVYLQNHRFVHASTSKGVVISDLRNPYYRQHFSKGGRIF